MGYLGNTSGAIFATFLLAQGAVAQIINPFIATSLSWSNETLALAGATDFWSAKALCESSGFTMMSVHSVAHVADALNLADDLNEDSKGYWIGLQRDSQDTRFYYMDGTEFDYSSWAVGEPKGVDSTQGCVYLGSGASGMAGQMIETECEKERYVLCSRTEAPFHSVPDIRQWQPLGLIGPDDRARFPELKYQGFVPQSRAVFCTEGGYIRSIQSSFNEDGIVVGVRVQCSRGPLVVEGAGIPNTGELLGNDGTNQDFFNNPDQGVCQQGVLVGFAGNYATKGDAGVSALVPICCPIPSDQNSTAWQADYGSITKSLWGEGVNCSIGEQLVPGIQSGTGILQAAIDYDIVNLCPASGSRNLHVSSLLVTYSGGDKSRFLGIQLAACKEIHVRKGKALRQLGNYVEVDHSFEEENWFDAQCQGFRNDYCVIAKWDPNLPPYFACELAGTNQYGVSKPYEFTPQDFGVFNFGEAPEICRSASVNITSGWLFVPRFDIPGTCVHCDNQEICNSDVCSPTEYAQYFRSNGYKFESGLWPGRCLEYSELQYRLAPCQQAGLIIDLPSEATMTIPGYNWTSDAMPLRNVTSQGSMQNGVWYGCPEGGLCQNLGVDLGHADVYIRDATNRSLVLQEPIWCRWEQVRCSHTGFITYLGLHPADNSRFNVSGMLSPEVFSFKQLRALSVRNTGLTWSLPYFANSTARQSSMLRSIDVRGSDFNQSLPADWSSTFSLPMLMFVGVAGTGVGGAIPSSWFDAPLYENLTLAVGYPLDPELGLCMSKPYLEKLQDKGTSYSLTDRIVGPVAGGAELHPPLCSGITAEWRFNISANGANLTCTSELQRVVEGQIAKMVGGKSSKVQTVKCSPTGWECWSKQAQAEDCKLQYGVVVFGGEKVNDDSLSNSKLQSRLLAKGFTITGLTTQSKQYPTEGRKPKLDFSNGSPPPAKALVPVTPELTLTSLSQDPLNLFSSSDNTATTNTDSNHSTNHHVVDQSHYDDQDLGNDQSHSDQDSSAQFHPTDSRVQEWNQSSNTPEPSPEWGAPSKEHETYPPQVPPYSPSEETSTSEEGDEGELSLVDEDEESGEQPAPGEEDEQGGELIDYDSGAVCGARGVWGVLGGVAVVVLMMN